jgi:uncharacterized OB-fold protein
MNTCVLPAGLPVPVPGRDGLERPYWEGTLAHELRVQRCKDCGTWRWGPEWICWKCRSFATDWVAVEPVGHVFSWERAWHPVAKLLADAMPYVVVLVELRHAGGVRMVGNLVGDVAKTTDKVEIGARLRAVFEDHAASDKTSAYTLVHWALDDRR